MALGSLTPASVINSDFDSGFPSVHSGSVHLGLKETSLNIIKTICNKVIEKIMLNGGKFKVCFKDMEQKTMTTSPSLLKTVLWTKFSAIGQEERVSAPKIG